MKRWLQTGTFWFIVVLFNAGERKKKPLVASAGVEPYLLTDWEHDTVWESLPLRLAPSVLPTGSLQWISLFCVCLLSHCGGRRTPPSPEAASACLAVRGRGLFLAMVCGHPPPRCGVYYSPAPPPSGRWQCFIFCRAGQVFISQIKCVSG